MANDWLGLRLFEAQMFTFVHNKESYIYIYHNRVMNDGTSVTGNAFNLNVGINALFFLF